MRQASGSFELQRLPRGPARHARVVAPARQEPDQSRERLLRREPAETPHAPPGELEGPILVGVVNGVFERVFDRAALDALGYQPTHDRSAPGLPNRDLVLDDLPGEGLVVHQTDVLEPGELTLHLVRIEAGTPETQLQLAARAWPNGEEAERSLVAVEGRHDEIDRAWLGPV